MASLLSDNDYERRNNLQLKQIRKKKTKTKKSMMTQLSSLGKLSSITFKEFKLSTFEESNNVTLQYRVTGEAMQCTKDDLEHVIKQFYIDKF